nr:RNA-directed DNA polymerase, eukaryota [Tanacetum cinerariifolium]
QADSFARASSSVGIKHLIPSRLTRYLNRWVCDVTGDGEFRVRDIRTTLDNLLLPSSVVATKWVKHVPIKVNIFVWRARLDRLPTRGAISLKVLPKSCVVGGAFSGLTF